VTVFRRTPREQQSEEPGGLGRFVRDRVIVHTRDAQSLRGFVAADYDDLVVLEHAERLTSAPGDTGLEARATPVGTIGVLHANVSVVQILGPVPDEIAPATPTAPVNLDRVVPLVNGAAS
jgi:hypothetical protein